MRDLGRDERVLAWARLIDGRTVIATQHGLWLPAGAGMRQVPWHLIDKATWRGGVLEVVEADEVEPGVVEDRRPLPLTLAEPRDLPPVVRARVIRSVAYTAHHPLPAGGGVRVVGRRVSGQDGLSWVVRFDRGADRADPAMLAVADELVAQAKGLAGVPE